MSPLDTRGNSWVEMTGPLTTLPVWGKPGLLDPESPRAVRPPGQASQRTPPEGLGEFCPLDRLAVQRSLVQKAKNLQKPWWWVCLWLFRGVPAGPSRWRKPGYRQVGFTAGSQSSPELCYFSLLFLVVEMQAHRVRLLGPLWTFCHL